MTPLQVVIPMSGFGERFRAAGYRVPKPLIEVEGRPVIRHVVELFPGETEFIFVCNQEHLDNGSYHMREILAECCPTGRVVGIAPHKLGPVYAVRLVEGMVDPGRPVVVNYCDFTCYWNYQHFKAWVVQGGCDGAVPAYRGFHPHSLGTTNYAYIREADGWLVDIQEKQPFSSDRMAEYASSGTYYFSRASLLFDYAKRVMDERMQVNGEYYVSLLYKLMAMDGLAIGVYPLQHFMQWGTPEDLAEYRSYSKIFHDLLSCPLDQVPSQGGTTIVPMAGLGARFAAAGYDLPKPLIPVSGAPMAVQAARDVPRAERQVFVLRRDLPGLDRISAALKAHFPRGDCVVLPGVTDGQARTVLLAVHQAGNLDMSAPLTIAACDNGIVFGRDAFLEMTSDDAVDVIVWATRAHPAAIRSPRMFSWIESEDGVVRRVSMKAPVGRPEDGLVVIGTFTFRRAADFVRSAERMIGLEDRTNGEYYADACVNHALALGLRCRVLLVESYLAWGTPDELRTYEYWQSCFHKWGGHPYSLFDDSRVQPECARDLDARYAPVKPVALRPRAKHGT